MIAIWHKSYRIRKTLILNLIIQKIKDEERYYEGTFI